MSARVLGLGAPVGDDAVGLAVARELVRRGVPASVEVREVAEASRLVPLLEGRDLAILVDAVLDAGPPGRVLRLSLDDLRRGARPLSTHGVGVLQAIELARLTSTRVCPSIVLVGVSIARPGPGDRLSPEVERAVPEAAALVLAILAASGEE